MDRKTMIDRLNEDLAGEPTTTPRPVPPARTNREMLETILAAERKATAD